MLEKSFILENVVRIFNECPGNRISEQVAICPEVSGIQMFEEPLMGVASAADDLFEAYKKEEVIGPWHMTPPEWIPGAKTVISFFFPFTEDVKKGNRAAVDQPSPAWLHGRVEGQEFIISFTKALSEWFAMQGIANCTPCVDPRFLKIVAGSHVEEYPCANQKTFGSNWSERHAAFACGLGTFGLSKGIITEKGMAGRFTSIILDAEVEADQRAYSDVYEYCTKCGACVRRCPAQAISLESGKDHIKCNACLTKLKEVTTPRFGCGFCQTKVPCESRNPKKNHVK